MIAVMLGLFAALCWSIHDLTARHFASDTGPYRMGLWVMLIGALLLIPAVAWRGVLDQADGPSLAFALAMGGCYAFAVGALLKAFSLAPVSVVGPFTAGYPALVVVWGVVNGLAPSLAQWLAIAAILGGAITVARTGHSDGGFNLVTARNKVTVILASGIACICFAASIILGQKAALTLGEFETTFISRFPAALLLWPMARREPSTAKPLARSAWLGFLAMAVCDVLAVSGINYSGQFANKELAAMGISAYGGLSVLLAMIVLRERVSMGQWAGIALIVAGVGYLGVYSS